MLILVALLAPAFVPDPAREHVSAILAATAAAGNPGSGKRCLVARQGPLDRGDVSSMLRHVPADWSRRAFAGAQAALGNATAGPKVLDSMATLRIEREGWTVLPDAKFRRRARCGLFVTMNGPVLSGDFGFARVTYSFDTGSLHERYVQLRHISSGWAIAAVGEGSLIVF